jgi:hypothetical protein
MATKEHPTKRRKVVRVRTRKLETDFRKAIRAVKIAGSRYLQAKNVFAAAGVIAVEASELFEAFGKKAAPLEALLPHLVHRSHPVAVATPAAATPVVSVPPMSAEDVSRIELHEDDAVARIIYECFTQGEHNWNSAMYQAPETWTGEAARRAQLAANLIRTAGGLK